MAAVMGAKPVALVSNVMHMYTIIMFYIQCYTYIHLYISRNLCYIYVHIYIVLNFYVHCWYTCK